MLKRTMFFVPMTLTLFLFNTLFAATSLAQENSPSPSPTTKPQVSSYELFWPIVAGKVDGDPLYSLKLLKERLREMLIFSKVNKASLYLTLSKKRLVETEKLLSQESYATAEKTLKTAKNEFSKTVELALAAKKEGRQVETLFVQIGTDGRKELDFLQSLKNKLPEEKSSPYSEALESIQEQINKLEGQ